MVLINHVKRTKRLYLFQISWVYLRALLFCFQDCFKVFHSSTLLHVNLHAPLGNPIPVLAPIMWHKNFPAGCEVRLSPPNLVFWEYSLQWITPIPLHYFSVSNEVTHTCTNTNGKAKIHVTNRNIFLTAIIILQNFPWTNGRKCLWMSLCWVVFSFLCFTYCV